MCQSVSKGSIVPKLCLEDPEFGLVHILQVLCAS